VLKVTIRGTPVLYETATTAESLQRGPKSLMAK